MEGSTVVSILFGGASVAAVVAGLVLFRRCRGPLTERLAVASLPLLSVIALTHLIGQAFNAPFEAENALRLTATFTIFSDYKLYTLPAEGPIICNMYPPLAYLVFLPATLASSPTTALVIASAVSLLSLLGCTSVILWLFRGKTPLPFVAITILAAAFIIIHSPSMWFTAHRVRPDAPGLAMTALAGALLFRIRDELPFKTLLIVGTLAAMAVWTKQVFIFVYPPLIVSMMILGGRQAAFRLIVACFLSGVAVSAVFFLAFLPPDRMLFNFASLPGKQPFYDRTLREWLVYMFDFLNDMTLPLILAGAVVFMASSSSSAGAGLKQWLRENRWAMFLLLAVGLAPATLLNQVKVGGLPNANAFVIFSVLLAGLTGCMHLMNHERFAHANAAPVSLVLAIALTLGLFSAPEALTTARDGTNAFNNDSQEVFQYLSKGEQPYWFPWQPLGVLMATGKVYHTEEGLASLHWLAGQPVLTDEQYARFLPANMRHIAIPQRWENGLQGKSEYFGKRVGTSKAPGLSGWILYELNRPRALDAQPRPADVQNSQGE